MMRQVSSPVRRGAGRKGRKDLARSLPGFKVLEVLFLAQVSQAFLGTFQNRAKVVDSFCGDGSCLAGGFLKTVNWNLKGALFCLQRRHVGYTNFGTFEFANSIPPF